MIINIRNNAEFHKDIRSNICLIFLLLLIIVATSKYVRNGELYTFETPVSDDILIIDNKNVISQEIYIKEGTKWDCDSFSIKFQQVSRDNDGIIQLTLIQDGLRIYNYGISVNDIKYDDFTTFKFDYNALKYGGATLALQGNNLNNPVGVQVISNTYNLPNCTLNGKDTGLTLVQRYKYHFLNKEYWYRILAFVVFVVLVIICFFISISYKETKAICNVIYALLAISYVAMAYIYDSARFWEPTWCEAITNFISNAIDKNFIENIWIDDSGYLPLLQRIITLFYIKIIGMTAYNAAFAMQMTAYMIAGFIVMFFVKYNFHFYMDLKLRMLISLAVSMQLFAYQINVFINFVPYGIYIILLYFLEDEKERTKLNFIGYSVLAFLFCLSKGQYVIVLPLMALCLLIFYKTYSKREIYFMVVTGCGAFFQLLFYLLQDMNWIDRKGQNGQRYYLVKVICEVIRDVPMQLFSIFESNISFFNGIAMILIIAFWFFLIYFFFVRVIGVKAKQQVVNKDIRNLYMYIFFLIASLLFFRITAYGIGSISLRRTSFWNFYNKDVQYRRYEVFNYFAILCSVFIFIKHAKKWNIYGINGQSLMSFFLVICVMIANPRLQLQGVEQDTASDQRPRISQLYSEVKLLKGIEDVICRVVPIQGNTWTYNKNAQINCLGTNFFQWQWISQVVEGDISDGIVYLSDYPEIDTSHGIWQIFVARRTLLGDKKYKLILKNKSNNVIKEILEESDINRRVVSFTFNEPVFNIEEVQVVDENGRNVFIENAMYFVSEQKE